MNILMVHPHDLFDKSEPWTIRIKNIAREFAKENHEVKLCYFPLSIDKNKICVPSRLESIELIPLDRTPSPGSFMSNIFRLVKLARWADVVHFQKCQHYASLPAVLAAYIAKKPLHYDWDDWEEKIWYESCGRGINSRFIGLSFKILERYLVSLSDSISCSSAYLKKLAVRRGKKRELIFDAPVGADRIKFSPDKVNGRWVRDKYNIKDEYVLYIGQLHGAQYVDMLIKAANIVLHKRPSAKFLIVGEGFMMPRLKEIVYDLGLEDKVIFTGSVPHDDIPFYIEAADVCAAPFNNTEVTRCKSPLKIVEYLAMGKIIVASCVGEVRNMLGGCGVLVEAGSYHKLAEGIIWALDNKHNIEGKIKERTRRRIDSKYNWHYTASNILNAYRAILRN